MNKFAQLQKYFSLEESGGTLTSFGIDAVLTVIVALLLAQIYIWFGNSISNRKKFAQNFPLLALTTMMMIAIIKSSLALSLGLVGALSIIRFRSAIKEPEELAYIFMTIALGLGFGASQRGFTLLFSLFVMAFLVIRGILSKQKLFPDLRRGNSIYFDVSIKKSETVSLNTISKLLKKYCSFVALKRMDQDGDTLQLLFIIKIKNPAVIDSITAELKKADKSVAVSVLDDESIFS